MELFDNLFEKEDNGATFSEDRKHRLSLWRIWDREMPLVMFIGLNPSTANETEVDPTIRRVIGFAKRWGYGGVYMMNVYTFVTPYPAQLKTETDHDANYKKLSEIGSLCAKVIFAWGNFTVFDRVHILNDLFPDAFCLGRNKSGTPKHPLYLKDSTYPEPFK